MKRRVDERDGGRRVACAAMPPCQTPTKEGRKRKRASEGKGFGKPSLSRLEYPGEKDQGISRTLTLTDILADGMKWRQHDIGASASRSLVSPYQK